MEGFPSREEALEDFFAAWEPTLAEELVDLDAAVGRVLARDIAAANTLPVVRASSFDGIAVKSAAFANGLPDTSGWKLGVDYVRADTGDDFPDEFDAVVMIEKAASSRRVGGAGRRRESGARKRRAPRRVNPESRHAHHEGGAAHPPHRPCGLAMAGATMVPCAASRAWRHPHRQRAGACGIRPRRGQNVDTNSLMVKHLLIQYGAEPVMFPFVHDDPAEWSAPSQRRLPWPTPWW